MQNYMEYWNRRAENSHGDTNGGKKFKNKARVWLSANKNNTDDNDNVQQRQAQQKRQQQILEVYPLSQRARG